MNSKSSKTNNLLKADILTLPYQLSNDVLTKINTILMKEFERGLKSTQDSVVKMYLTYVRSLPNKEERGKYLALDLGGTNFRILLIEFNQENFKIIDLQMEPIPTELFYGTGQQLFDYIAQHVVDFAIRNKLVGVRIALGFCFSFPVIQRGLAEATLVTWTKSFDCSGVVGYDVVRLLKASLKRKMIHSIPFIDVVAIINDTTGTLICGALQDKNCKIGLIVGTGSNACYVEKLQKIEKWPFNYGSPDQVVINCECGAFGDDNVLEFVTTVWDRALNYESLNIDKQIHEKLISGMYLPELLRRTIITLIEKGILFQGKAPLELFKPYSIETKFMSFMDRDPEDLKETIFFISNHFKNLEFSEIDAKIVQMVNNRITRRSANFVANCLWALIKRIDGPNVSIAYDGSLICLHPHYKKWVEEKLNYLVSLDGLRKKINLIKSSDGSLYGASIVSAICYREKRPKFIKKAGKIYEITRC
ncbi:transforming growth factor-beta receptor type I [Sarcoptes scabiei]|nr:transforming growth factor-beta receptor type I [Sarcoptes scabiei]